MFAHDTTHYQSPRVVAPAPVAASEAGATDEAAPSGDFGTPVPSTPDDVDSQMFAHDTTHYQPPRVIAPAIQPRDTFSSLPGSKAVVDHFPRLDALLGEGALGVRLKSKMARTPQDKSISSEDKNGQPLQTTQASPDAEEKSLNRTVDFEGQASATKGTDISDPLAAGIRALMDTAPGQEGLENSLVADPDSLYRQAVVLKDSCALYWLARSFEPNPPIPMWLAELLHLGSHYQSCFVSLRERITKLCDEEATRNVQNLNDGQKLLLATAILRPALLMPAQSMHSITTILAILESDLTDYGLRKFIEELRQFVRCGKPLADSLFSAQSAQEQKKQKDFLRKETEKLFQRSLKGKIIFMRLPADCGRSSSRSVA